MRVNYKIIQAKDFIKAKPTGQIDLDESKKVLGQIAKMEELIGDHELLVDLREVHSNLDKDDLFELILELGRHKEAFRSKIAVMARDDEQFNKAVFLEMCANIDGFTVMAFTDYEEAINWLQSDGGIEDLWP
ncbi:MAG TPA: hypothetical protein VMW72_08455 [Sedimentisphaerales bacterium]|nr:hypothetical protein [Sedimentisphaerales bacterium]